MLKQVTKEQKMIRKSIQRIINLMLIIVFMMVGKETAARGDASGKLLCRIGLGLTGITQLMLVASDIEDLVKSRKEDDYEEDFY